MPLTSVAEPGSALRVASALLTGPAGLLWEGEGVKETCKRVSVITSLGSPYQEAGRSGVARMSLYQAHPDKNRIPP